MSKHKMIHIFRKYRSLEVRYTRLRQGPMRFTFTSEGESLEEEDWKEDEEEDKDEEDEDTHQMNTFQPFEKDKGNDL